MGLTKKALLLLRLPEKYSFTFRKLRFFGLRKPKNSFFIQFTPNNKRVTQKVTLLLTYIL